MLKIRLKRLGAKKNPTYRVVVINSTTKREGRPVQELGHYNPKTKEMKLDKVAALDWVKKGAQPTETVAYLIKNCNEDGTLNYVKKETVKLSKKAQAKAKAEAKEKAKDKAEEKATSKIASSQYDKDARVRTGAYRIIGVAQTVTVSAGQTLEQISTRYLGSGMECYVEALNGTSTIKAGQKIKIPKLELKKKKK